MDARIKCNICKTKFSLTDKPRPIVKSSPLSIECPGCKRIVSFSTQHKSAGGVTNKERVVLK